MSLRQPMPQRKAEDRIKDFEEVNLGYTEDQAISEARRCPQCKNPLCVKGCPVEINIPEMIKYIATGDFKEAIKKAKEKNSLPAICGRVCPQEDQCEKVCILNKQGKAINIGALERYIADYEAIHSPPSIVQSQKKLSTVNCLPAVGEVRQRRPADALVEGQLSTKVAVIGSGPAGLTCAADLAKMGYKVTIFESLSEPGGVLRYGIPPFRLNRKVVNREIEYVKRLGVDIEVNMLIGQIKTIEDLFNEGYRAVFIGTGAGLPNFMHIPGENLNNIYSANEFLTRINLMKAFKFPEYDTPIACGKKVAVIGAGNVAIDSARCALRLGAEEVYIIYRRSEQEMPARKEEIIHAKEEGVKFLLLALPVEFYPAPCPALQEGLDAACRSGVYPDEKGRVNPALSNRETPGSRKGWVKKMRCIKMELGEPDASGRRRPVPIKDSDFEMDIDTVVIAIGQSPNPLLLKMTPGLKVEKHGNVIVDPDTLQTSIKGVFAGGDITTGAATVIEAMGAGKKAAVSIHKFLCG